MIFMRIDSGVECAGNNHRALSKQADGYGTMLMALLVLFIEAGCAQKVKTESNPIIDITREEKEMASDDMAYPTICVDKDGHWKKNGNIISEEDLVNYLKAKTDTWGKTEGKEAGYNIIYINGDHQAPYGQVKKLQLIILKSGFIPAEKHDSEKNW